MKSIRNKLAIATCTLLSQGAQQAGATESSWSTDASYLFYSEEDRVTVNKIVTNANVTLGDNHLLTLEAVYDTITGSTPTGAIKSGGIVTVTTPSSGGNGYKTASGTPDLAQFDDTRLGVNLGLTHSLNRTLRMNYGASVSVERDYEAYGGSLTFERDNEDRSLTLIAGVAGSYDTIFQSSGRTPKPMGNVVENNGNPEFFPAGNKRGFEGMLGVSRIINRRTVARFNYSIKSLEGYLTDPYKVISMTREGIEWSRYYESRPDSRLRQALYGKLVHQLKNRDTIQLSYRYYWDDWGIGSHTINYQHRRNLSAGQYLEPHLRLYNQSAADFFYHSLRYGQPKPEYASADYRLDEMNSLTLGLKYGRPAWGGIMRFRLEYLYQSFAEAEFDTNKVLIFQASFKKEFD